MSDREPSRPPEVPNEILQLFKADDLPKAQGALAVLTTEEIEDATPYLTLETMEKVLTALRGGSFKIEIGDTGIIVGEKMGGGGTKDVYRVDIKGADFALALPNIVDNPATALHKWTRAMSEPGNTVKVRESGLKANPFSKLIKVKINGTEFPAIVMLPYDRLPFRICDSKNPDQKGKILSDDPLSDEIFGKLFQRVMTTIRIIMKKGIRLTGDSFNLCRDENGEIDLYFNDLWRIKFNPPQDEEDRKYLAEFCVQWALNSFSQALTFTQWTKTHKVFCDRLNDQSSAIVQKLYEQASEVPPE